VAHRIPIDRLKTLARSGLDIGKVAGARATRAAASGVSRAVRTADAWRERTGGGPAAPEEATPTTGGVAFGAKPTAAPEPTPDQPAEAGPALTPTPTAVAKVVERKPAAEKAAARKAPPRKATKKPAKKAAPGAKLPPRKQADV
jgi:hypothetical protein